MGEDYLGWGVFDSPNLYELNKFKVGDLYPNYDPFRKIEIQKDTIDRRSVFDKLTETIRKEMEKAQVQKEIENKPLVEPDDTIKVRKITNGYIIEVDYEEVFVTNKNDIIKYLK